MEDRRFEGTKYVNLEQNGGSAITILLQEGHHFGYFFYKELDCSDSVDIILEKNLRSRGKSREVAQLPLTIAGVIHNYEFVS